MYQLIAFDLDGTMLASDKSVPQENIDALWEAAERGFTIVPATGRIPDYIPEPLKQLPFIRWCIAANGACIYDYHTRQIVERCEIGVERCIEVLDYAESNGWLLDCYQDNHGYVSQYLYDRVRDFISDPGTLKIFLDTRVTVPHLQDYLREKGMPVQKMQFYILDQARRARELATFSQRWPDLLATTSVPTNIEVNAAEANKGSALLRLCRLLQIPLEDTVAFGDDINDLTMIRAAGFGVAMENGKPELKQAAKAVAETNDRCGVGKMIRKILSEQQ